MNIQDLLTECLDALDLYDGLSRAEHLERIAGVISSEKTPLEACKLLQAAAVIFRTYEAGVRKHPVEQAEITLPLRTALMEYAKGHDYPLYAYHGTICGLLPQIKSEGLIPRKIPVWTSTMVHDQNIEHAVFFTSSWRSAMGWADTTRRKHYRRGKSFSSPAVIRLPASKLSMERDPLAAAPNTFIVKGTVPMDDAYVIRGANTTFPSWTQL